jgi:hypothetical protein
MEKKLKHLEFIQQAIERMASNLFLLKGWSVTLISALFALSAKDADKKYLLIAFMPVLMFWALSGYFLSQERKFRALYRHVANLSESEIDFSMSTTNMSHSDCGLIPSFVSPILLFFYGALVITLVITMYFL